MTVNYRSDRKKWAYNFRLGGQRYAGYAIHPRTGKLAANEAEAKRIEALIREDLERRAAEQPKPHRPNHDDYTLAQALASWAVRKQGKANWPNQRTYLAELLSWFGAETPAADITAERCWAYITWAREQPILVWRGAGRKAIDCSEAELKRFWVPRADGKCREDSTINRYLDPLREALRIAHETRVHGVPLLAEPPAVPQLEEIQRLPRPISDEAIRRLATETKAPAHLIDAILLVRNMGFRKAEVFGLQIADVDFDAGGVWLRGERTKGRRDEFVPANADAIDLLRRLVAQARERTTAYLLTYRPRKLGEWVPVRDPKRSFRTAMKQIGLDGQHVFHNTKAAYVTAVASTASAEVTRSLARHKDSRTTARYIQVVDAVRQAAVDAIAFAAPVTARAVGDNQDSQPAAGQGDGDDAKSLENMVGATGFEPATPRPPASGSSGNVLIFKKDSRRKTPE
jgi:integrase